MQFPVILVYNKYVEELCRTFNIARSIYYYRQNNDQDKNTNTENQLYTGHPAYDKDGNLVPGEDVAQLVKDYCDESLERV